MRIALVFNTEEREKASLDYLKSKILLQYPENEICILCRNAHYFIEELIHFAPDVMLTPPFTARGVARYAYITKILFGTRILCYRTEGMILPEDESHVLLVAGLEQYGPHLVDGEIFWGPLMQKVITEKLLQQGKLSSPERSVVTGYLSYEMLTTTPPALPSQIEDTFASYPEKERILFLTGFQMAEYTRKDILGCGDLIPDHCDQEEAIDNFMLTVEATKKHRSEYIETLVKTANDNKNLLIIAKPHPVELELIRNGKKDPYKESFSGIDNILYIKEIMDATALIFHCGVLVHYGSTCVAATHIMNKYAIMTTADHIFGDLVQQHNLQCYPTDFGWQSHASVPLPDVADFITRNKSIFGSQNIVNAADKNLLDFFNFSRERPYTPSEQIIEFLLSTTQMPPQTLANSPRDRIRATRALLVWFGSIGKRCTLSLMKGQWQNFRRSVMLIPYWMKMAYRIFCRL